MSATYPHLFNTTFPDQIDTFDLMQDISSSTIEFVKQYQTYFNNGQFQQASQVLIDHPELNNILINANKINCILDSIKSIEMLYSQDIQTYIQNLVTYCGDYSSSSHYNKYCVVNYTINGAVQSYMCTNLNCPTGTIPTNTDYWICITLRGEKGIGIGLCFLGQWNSGITYDENSAVAHNNILYASKVNNNVSHTPSTVSDWWDVIVDFNQTTMYDNSQSNLSATTMQNAITEVNTKTETCLSNITSHTSSITALNTSVSTINSKISNVDNTRDANKSVAYATNSNHAVSANSATNATNATYATTSGNASSVDGFSFTIGTTELTSGTSPLATNTFYAVYE